MVVPYKESKEDKKTQVRTMFDNIAHKYDFLNHFLSFGVDRYWRKKTITQFAHKNYQVILDIACGTGDFAFEALRLKPTKIIGIDLSEKMIAIGMQKASKKNVSNLIEFKTGDAENLMIKDNSVNLVMSAFGVRNFQDIEKGLQEMYRVLTPGGSIAILEFSQSANFFSKFLFNIYFNKILPFVGNSISKDKRAYAYLPESVKEFPAGQKFLEYLEKAGFYNLRVKKYTFGICCAYIAEKRENNFCKQK